jgi:predicted permease
MRTAGKEDLHMSELGREIRVALRAMLRDKTYALPVLVTLALCVAANAVVFTVVSSVVLRPLPLPQPERLVHVANSYPKAGVEEADNSVPDYYDRRQAVPAFAELALYDSVGRTLGTAAGAERVTAMVATPSLFPLLRAQALRGRTLGESDGVPGQEQKELLSYGLWRRLFAGREDAVGKTVRVNGAPHTVIGVMPRDFLFVDPEVSLWLPLAFAPEDRADDRRHSNNYLMIARLRPGATLAQAQQQIDALNRANLDRVPSYKQALIDAGYTTTTQPLQERLVGRVKKTLYLLWGAVLFVLVIGCVNVANLALVRSTSRAREVAARQALGAGPGRLLRQLLLESLLLSGGASLVGTALAYLLLRALADTAFASLPRANEITLGAPTVVLIAGVSLGVGLLLALIPLLHGSRANLARTIREEGRTGTASRSTRAVRRLLVASQVGIAFVLLLGAGLLLASFRELLRVDPGFEPAGVLTGKLSLPSATYADDAALPAWHSRFLERVRALPGVTAAGLGSTPPLTGGTNDSVILAEGYVAAPGESLISPSNNVVTPGYFEALGIEVKRGRAIDERDSATSQPVIVISEKLAEKFWRGKDPIGRRMYQPQSAEEVTAPTSDTQWVTIVGVVAEVKQRGLAGSDERFGAYYFPDAQQPARTMTLVAQVDGHPEVVATSVRRELSAIDPELPLYDVRTMEERVELSVAGERVAMRLAAGFAFVALLLATVGIFGVLAYQVSQRRREIGIRMALGSASGRVFRLVLGEGAALLGVGLAIGFAGLFALREALSAQLFGVTPFEPRVLGAVTGLLALVALAACVLPARRAARIDPVVALTD